MARQTKQKQHLIDKYKELVWALDLQGYNLEDIAVIFNRNRSTVFRTLQDKPEGWTPKWVKIQ